MTIALENFNLMMSCKRIENHDDKNYESPKSD